MYGPIIFSAYNISYREFTVGQYITGFEEFLINMGDNFSLTDGIFTAPRNGIYEFSASIYHERHVGEPHHLAVVRNSEQVVKFQDTQYATLTFNWIMKLQRGDKIQLQVESGLFYCDNLQANCIFNGKIL